MPIPPHPPRLLRPRCERPLASEKCDKLASSHAALLRARDHAKCYSKHAHLRLILPRPDDCFRREPRRVAKGRAETSRALQPI
jgi:hypothetical protein